MTCHPSPGPESAISFIPVTADNGALVTAWLDGDVQGMTHLSSYRDVPAWLGRLSENRHGWIAHVNDSAIGFLDVDIDGATGSFSYYVAPEHRRRGMGTALLLSLPALCDAIGVRRLVGYVEPENDASLAALRRAGFSVCTETDEDGMLAAVKDLTAGSR